MGATGSSYSKTNLLTADAGHYFVVVTNAFGTVISEEAVLTVTEGNVVPPSSPVVSIASSGNNVTLSWPAVAGQVYRVQHKGSLSDANWVNVPPDITAVGVNGFG